MTCVIFCLSIWINTYSHLQGISVCIFINDKSVQIPGYVILAVLCPRCFVTAEPSRNPDKIP